MISKSLNIQIVIRILILLAACLALGWIVFGPVSKILIIVPVLILVFGTMELVKFLNRVNRHIFYFFDAIKNEDSSLSFPESGSNMTIRELHRSMLRVNRQIQQVFYENRKQEQYFQALLEHAATGMFTYDRKGFILHSNSQAKQLLGVEVLTHISQLEAIDHGLHKTVEEIASGEHRLVTVNNGKEVLQLLLRANMFVAEKEELVLLSIQDIKKQLDEKELDSWKRLIRVMMHEIMNSISPVSSLSESLVAYFYTEGRVKTAEEIDDRIIETTIQGLEVIREQGKSLINFVESYRRLSRVPDPKKKMFPVSSLLDSIGLLSAAFPNAENVMLQCSLEREDFKVFADEKQITQVLINLVKNAFQALEGKVKGEVRIEAALNNDNRPEIVVVDNGPGIPEEILEKVFIPFFTTRENGSGIGLSISRQIMQLHGGSLNIDSVPGKGTKTILII